MLNATVDSAKKTPAKAAPRSARSSVSSMSVAEESAAHYLMMHGVVCDAFYTNELRKCSGLAHRDVTVNIFKNLWTWGQLTHRQAELVVRLHTEGYAKLDKFTERKGQWAKEKTERGPVPVGSRVPVSGTVVSVKMKDTDYGPTLKMVVDDYRKFRVYATVPAKIHTVTRPQGGERELAPGDVVMFIAGRLSASKDDPTFGFVSRPSKAAATAHDAAHV